MPAAAYREFAPHPALRRYVRAYFAFASSEWSSLFADAHTSLVFTRGGFGIEGVLDAPRDSAVMIGPMTRGRASWRGSSMEQWGVFFEPLGFGPANELVDRALIVDDAWTRRLEDALWNAQSDAERVRVLDSALWARVRQPDTRIAAITREIVRRGGLIRVDDLAAHAGVSRQHLTRMFREALGVSPKLYCRLLRFRGALAKVRADVDWAGEAVELGYADQSHMIAEFREFCGETPAGLAKPGTYHPFLSATTARLAEREIL